MWLTGKYAGDVAGYVDGILDGKILANKDRITACRRFKSMCADPRFEVRPRDADFVIGIIETTLAHRQGEKLDGTPLRGTPLKLEPWEKFCVYGMLAFYLPGTKERLVKEALIYIPRKNGKTAFVSSLAFALGLLERESGSKVYVVGAALKQARETFDNWLYNIRSHLYKNKAAAEADGWRILDNSFEHSISCEHIAGGSVSLNALASNPDRVFSKDEIFRNIWDMDSIGDIATVTVHIKKIREKVEADSSNPQYIETIWGVGYRFRV